MPDRSRYHGLDEYILRYSSILPLSSSELYRRVSDQYGYIEPRTFYRHLEDLSNKGHLIVSISEYNLDLKYAYDTKCYSYRSKKKKNRCVFQKQYIDSLKKRVLLISHL